MDSGQETEEAVEDYGRSPAPSAKRARVPPVAAVYVLRLRNGHAYVGQTDDMVTRMKWHEESPNAWEILGGDIEGSPEDPWVKPQTELSEWERQETLVRMLAEGHDSVRGWEFVTCAGAARRGTTNAVGAKIK